MYQNLKTQLVHSIFQFKKIMGSGFMDTALMRASGSMQRAQMNQHAQKQYAENKNNINMSELFLMNVISDNTSDSEKNICLSEVRGYLSVSKAAISHMLGSLEKKKFINREIDKNNRRNLIVTLTPKGRKVLINKYDEFSGRLEKVINHLGENDVNQMIAIINRMIEIKNKLDNEEI